MKYRDFDRKRVKERRSIRRKLMNFFKRKETRYTKETRGRMYKSLFGGSFVKILSTIMFAVVLILVLLLLINYVSNLRKSFLNGSQGNQKNVVGFDNIPEFKNSTFIFKDSVSDDNVKRFLSSGQSIYRLNPANTIEEVYEYYSQILPERGWEHVLSVPLASEEQKNGEYWIKNNIGVRIYSKLNDIWYQTVTSEQAKNGLSDQVKKEVELQLLLSESDKEDLRPDFPWKLSYSSDYIATYGSTDIGELIKVSFSKLGSNKVVTIEPLGYMGAFSYDKFLENGLKKINKSSKSKLQVVNTSLTLVAGQEALFAKLTNSGKLSEAYVVGNPRDQVVYLFMADSEGDPFLKFVVEKIEPAKSSLN